VNKACFVAGTQIKTIDGLENIEDIEVGDLVYSRNEKTGEQGYKEVSNAFSKEVDTLIYIYVGTEKIETTYEHPFWVINKGWVNAEELKVGQNLLLASGEITCIDNIVIERQEQLVSVYNFTVEDWHTYFVSDSEIFVHNANCIPVPNSTKASNGLYYKSNGKHTLGQPGNRPNAGIEPRNSLDLFGDSVSSSKQANTRYTYDTDTNTLHRFFGSEGGDWHWSGSTNQGVNSLTGKDVPIDVKRLFNLPKKGW
jgi:hypothetical protein